MVHSAAIVVLAGFGLYPLSKLILMWIELGYAKGHVAIDRKGLHEWLARFEKKIALVNLVAFLSVVSGILGILEGRQMLATSCGSLIAASFAVGLLALCARFYSRFYGEFSRVVGVKPEIASKEVAGDWS